VSSSKQITETVLYTCNSDMTTAVFLYWGEINFQNENLRWPKVGVKYMYIIHWTSLQHIIFHCKCNKLLARVKYRCDNVMQHLVVCCLYSHWRWIKSENDSKPETTCMSPQRMHGDKTDNLHNNYNFSRLSQQCHSNSPVLILEAPPP